MMPIKRMKIHGYRGFINEGIVNFAVPNGNVGSGLTFITGPNNSGKSTILECLQMREGNSNPSFSEGKRNQPTDFVTIEYEINGETEWIKSIKKGTSETTRGEKRDASFQVFSLPSRRNFAHVFNGFVDMSREAYVRNNSNNERSSGMPNFQFRLTKINGDSARFDNELKGILGRKLEWSIDKADTGGSFIRIFKNNHAHTSEGAGEGLLSVLTIVDALYDSKAGDVVVIDEPELSLHPALQRRLMNYFADHAKNKQIIVSTHSPYFIDIASILSGAKFCRVISDDDGSKVYELSEEGRENLEKLSKDTHNLHILGLDAREIFFQEDDVILVEGQEDVFYLPKAAEQVGKQIGGNFFGWGSGGSGKIALISKILQDLGFRKVVGIFDNDKEEERKRAAETYPKYKFACIPAKDIRTKKAVVAEPEVLGLLDKSGVIRQEYKEPFRQFLAELFEV